MGFIDEPKGPQGERSPKISQAALRKMELDEARKAGEAEGHQRCIRENLGCAGTLALAAIVAAVAYGLWYNFMYRNY